MISIKKLLTKILTKLNAIDSDMSGVTFLRATSMSSGTFTLSNNYRGFLFIATSSSNSNGFYAIDTTSTGSVVTKNISAASSGVTVNTNTTGKVTISISSGTLAVCFMTLSGTVTKTS